MVADKPFGLKFLDVFGATTAQLPYLLRVWTADIREGTFLCYGILWGWTLAGNH